MLTSLCRRRTTTSTQTGRLSSGRWWFAPRLTANTSTTQKPQLISWGFLNQSEIFRAALNKIKHMARCTAPSRGHRTASGAADCPACGSRYGSRYSGGYDSYPSYSAPSYTTPSYSSGGNSSGGRSSGGGRSIKPRWSRGGSGSGGGATRLPKYRSLRQFVRTSRNDSPSKSN